MQRLKKFGVILLLTFMSLTSLLYLFQERLIFLPSTLDKDYQYNFSEPFKEIFIEAPDGAQLNGLHFKKQNNKGVILYFHGNAGDLSRWGQIAINLVKMDFDVVIMDYRSYGKSTGKLSEEALFKDAQLFYNYVIKQYATQDIIIYGRSLGGAIATHLASNNKASKLMLETPFYNLHDVAKDRFPFLPLQLLLKYNFNSNHYIKKVQYPIAIFHGTSDNVVPYTSGKKLFDAATTDEKYFYTILEGGHNDLDQFPEFNTGIQKELSNY